MTGSEAVFLLLGLAVGAALGAVLLAWTRARPPRPAVRLTITHNAIPPRSASAVAIGGGQPGTDVLAHAAQRIGVPVARGVDPAYEAAVAPPLVTAPRGGRSGGSQSSARVAPRPAASSHTAPAPGEPVLAPLLRGDRAARARIAASLSRGDRTAQRHWDALLSDLVDGLRSRAIEESYVDVDANHPFWSQFATMERRDIVRSLASLGFRTDGTGGFEGRRVPSQRDAMMALGFAGADPIRVRGWPAEAGPETLYRGALVAVEAYLAERAPELSREDVAAAMGPHAERLADLWSAWELVRRLLLSRG